MHIQFLSAHPLSTSSMVAGSVSLSRVRSAKASRESILCHSRINCLKDICPVVSNFLMVDAGTELRSASICRDHLRSLRFFWIYAAHCSWTSAGVSKDNKVIAWSFRWVYPRKAWGSSHPVPIRGCRKTLVPMLRVGTRTWEFYDTLETLRYLPNRHLNMTTKSIRYNSS